MRGNRSSPWCIALLSTIAQLVCACSTHTAAATTNEPLDENVVAVVEREPIVAQEFLRSLAQERAGVAAEFRARYDVSPAGPFWTTPLGQQRPIDVLRKKAIDHAIRVKVEQIAMRAHGITQDVSYPGFLKQLDQENVRRREALRLGQPIFGPQQYGEQEFYEYTISNGLLALKQVFSTRQEPDGELRQDYESLKESMFNRGRQVKVEIARAEYHPASPNDNVKDTARAAMEIVLRRVRAGQSLATATKQIAGVGRSDATYEQVREHKRGSATNDAIADAARQLVPNASSGIIDVGFAFVVVRCVAVTDLGHVPFEEARGPLQARRHERAFERYLQDLVDHADIRIVPEVYERVAVD